MDTGVLTRGTFAWSRDQEEKVYVQGKLMEHKEEVWDWLQRGAAVYVCGDAHGMAPGVAEAFRAIAVGVGGVLDGEAWLENLVREDRYKTDVY